MNKLERTTLCVCSFWLNDGSQSKIRQKQSGGEECTRKLVKRVVIVCAHHTRREKIGMTKGAITRLFGSSPSNELDNNIRVLFYSVHILYCYIKTRRAKDIIYWYADAGWLEIYLALISKPMVSIRSVHPLCSFFGLDFVLHILVDFLALCGRTMDFSKKRHKVRIG